MSDSTEEVKDERDNCTKNKTGRYWEKEGKVPLTINYISRKTAVSTTEFGNGNCKQSEQKNGQAEYD